MSLADIKIVVAPALSGMNKGVMDGHTLYVAPEVFDLMGDSQETCDLVLKHLKVITMPRDNRLAAMAMAILRRGGIDGT